MKLTGWVLNHVIAEDELDGMIFYLRFDAASDPITGRRFILDLPITVEPERPPYSSMGEIHQGLESIGLPRNWLAA